MPTVLATSLAWYHANQDEFDKELAAEVVDEERARHEIADAPRP